MNKVTHVTWESIKGYWGQKINGVSFNIDIINACSLRCPSCAVGSIAIPRGGKKMSIDLFRRILDKAQSECKVRKVQFYAYSDPCLHPDLHLFIQETTDRGIYSAISTMLQTYKCDMAKVIEARPTEFRISFPGWEKMAYYQRGAKPEVFDKHFPEICSLPRYKETKWNLIFHLYNDNGGEYERVKRLASKWNLHLVALPAIFMPLETMVEKAYTKDDKELISHLLETPEESIGRMKLNESYCYLWKQLAIDANGDTFLCQLVYREEFKLVPFLDHPLKDIQHMIRTHSFCGKCMKAGGQQYQRCYSDMALFDNPIADADRERRKSKVNEGWAKVVKRP